jgi:hypothetical protein
MEKLATHPSWRSAKLHTRLGMGHCQGRVCGAATEFLMGWPMDSVRPPLFPVSVNFMASAAPAPSTGETVDPATNPTKQLGRK